MKYTRNEEAKRAEAERVRNPRGIKPPTVIAPAPEPAPAPEDPAAAASSGKGKGKGNGQDKGKADPSAEEK